MLPNPYIIHLESCKERAQTQKHLEDIFVSKITLFHAKQITWSPKIHWKSPWGFKEMTPGQLGCNASHYTLYKSLTDVEYATIFEDDASASGPFEILIEFLNIVPKTFDIILLGYNDITSGYSENGYRIVKQFYGTHAMIINAKARKCFIDEYDKMMSTNTCLPTDWLWGHCISKYGLKCYAPTKPSIIQQEGVISCITGKPRINKKF
jgi:hypothetical protein